MLDFVKREFCQIFLNFFGNALDVFDDLDQEEKKIQIYTKIEGGKISFVFSDNALGCRLISKRRFLSVIFQQKEIKALILVFLFAEGLLKEIMQGLIFILCQIKPNLF